MNMRKMLRMGAILGIGFGIATEAFAQEQPRRARPRGRRVIRFSDVVVEGRVQKPQAFYILQRSNLNFRSLELKQSFIPKILESVEKAPFSP